MADGAIAREPQLAKVYQLPASRTVTGLPFEISAILERLNEIGVQQEKILQILQETSEREAQPNITSSTSLAGLVEPSSLQSMFVSAKAVWSSVGVTLANDQSNLIGETSTVSYVGGEQEELGTDSANQNSALTGSGMASDGVPLPKLLSVGAVVLAAFSVTSLATWLIGSIPLVHPVVSLMSLVAAPFIYWMSRAAKSDLEGHHGSA